MVVTENKEEMSILGLLFSDYDFISLFKMKSKSVNKEEYISFLKETFKKIDNEYSLIDDEEKKIIRPCTDAFKNNPAKLEKHKGKTSYFYN